MQAKVRFSEKQKEYKYEKLENNIANVFIRKFIEEIEEIMEDGNKIISYEYLQNEFKVDSKKITEKMIKDNPLKYIDYNPKEEIISDKDRISALEDAITEIAEVIYNG